MANLDEGIEYLGELESVEAQIKTEEAKKEEVPEVPPAYQGKSVLDVIKLHQDTERIMSRQGMELGELRKLTDELLKAQLADRATKEQPKEVDFFENPQEAMRLAVENNPQVLAAKQIAEETKRFQAQQKLAQMHPDFGEIVGDTKFANWVMSSKERMDRYRRAENFDIDAADDLLSTFKQLYPKAKPVTVDKEEQKLAIKGVSVDAGSGGEAKRKIYRRADLRNLRIVNRTKYDAMIDEINLAYAEGRVR